MDIVLSWKEVKERLGSKQPSLLLGNGFSVGVSKSFDYKYLYEEFKKVGRGGYLCVERIFNDLGTQNFEDVLNAIYHAHVVSIDNKGALNSLYMDVRGSLIHTIKTVHPQKRYIPTREIGSELLMYTDVFTTNYDLLTYWSLLSVGTDRFVDYFWTRKGNFNLRNTYIFNQNSTKLYFLHGAIHICSEGGRDARKLKTGDGDDFREIIGLQQVGGSRPLFITEGTSRMKIGKIKGNEYLNFCYEQLIGCDRDLIIYGHGLSKHHDSHIVDAIKNGKVKDVYIGVYSDLSFSGKRGYFHRVKEMFSDSEKNVQFFESNTHPFSNF